MNYGKYTQPSINSSFAINSLGYSIFSATILLKPVTIYEFGALGGYSTVSLLQALRFLGGARQLKTYDLFERYPYHRVDKASYENNVRKHKNLFTPSAVSHSVHLTDILANLPTLASQVLTSPMPMIFLDISNTCEIIQSFIDATHRKVPILFEGGTSDRDNVAWMTEYRKTPITMLRDKGYPYITVNSSFPGLSVFLPG